MRRKSSNPEFDKILETQYNECYNIILEDFKDKNPVFLASFYKSQVDFARMKEKSYRKKHTFEDKLDSVLEINAAHALRDACIKLLKQKHIN